MQSTARNGRRAVSEKKKVYFCTQQKKFDVLWHMQTTARNRRRAVSEKVDFCRVHLAGSL